MSEQIENTSTPTAVVPEPTPTQAVSTPTAAVSQPTIDVNAIVEQAAQKAIEAAEKKQDAVFRSMLQQQGLDAKEIAEMVAERKAKEKTPEQILAEKDGIISEKDQALLDAQTALDNERKAYQSKLTTRAVRDSLRDLKADPEMLQPLMAMLREDGVIDQIELDEHDNVKNADVLEGLKEKYPKFFLSDKPEPQVRITAPGQGAPPSQTDTEALQAAYKRAQSLGRTAEMSRIIREAKKKNIKLF